MLQQDPATTFGWINWTVLVGYLAAVVFVGLRCARREASTDQFFLARQRIPGWAAGLSIYGTQLSALTFMAIPAAAYAENWVRITGSLTIVAVLPIVIRYYLPLFRRLQTASVYEYLEKRFNFAVRIFANTTWILLQFGRMGIVLFLPATALSITTGMDVFLCIACMGMLATLYTTLGGIAADIWTDVMQVFVLLGGALLGLVLVVERSGGMGEVIATAAASGKFDVVLPGWDPSQMVLWVMICGTFFTNLIPYTTDQTVVQRYLTTPNLQAATRSLWINVVMTLPTALLFFGLGTALHVYYALHPELATPPAADQIVPWFISRELPVGVAGLLIAAIFAAAMSSLDSAMNSVATVIVTDYYRRFRPRRSDRHYLNVARSLTLLLGCIGTLVAAGMASSDIRLLADFFNQVLGLFGGSLAGVFFLAVFTRRANATGALLGAVCGFAATAAAAFATSVSFYLCNSLAV